MARFHWPSEANVKYKFDMWLRKYASLSWSLFLIYCELSAHVEEISINIYLNNCRPQYITMIPRGSLMPSNL